MHQFENQIKNKVHFVFLNLLKENINGFRKGPQFMVIVQMMNLEEFLEQMELQRMGKLLQLVHMLLIMLKSTLGMEVSGNKWAQHSDFPQEQNGLVQM